MQCPAKQLLAAVVVLSIEQVAWCMGHFFFEAFISFQKWVLPAVSSRIAVDSGPNIALETCLFAFLHADSKD